MGKSKKRWIAQRRQYRQEGREFRAACEAGDPEALSDPRYEEIMGKYGKKMRKGEQVALDPPDWSAVDLQEVKKDFYKEHPLVTARDEAAIKEYRDKNRISVEGRDCPKPIQSFDECSFSESVMSVMKAKNDTPTPIQSQGFPIALSGRDMVGIAEPGSGKTLAFILPAITHIHGKARTRNAGEPDVVVLAPSNELAVEIHQAVMDLGPDIKVTSECFYGGGGTFRRKEQRRYTDKVFEICVATPGRLVDFVYEELIKLHQCSYLVVDQLDRMFNNGLVDKVEMIIEQARPDRQILMFSATWPPEIQEFAETYLKDNILLKISALQPSECQHITQKIEICETADKPKRIAKIMGEVMKQKENKTLMFANSKFEIDLLTLKLRMNGWDARGLHGSKKQFEREKILNDFKEGRFPILIATDLAVRGFDVNGIKFIISYEYPACFHTYFLRIGHTGHGNGAGTAITLFTPNDRNGAEDLILFLEKAGQHVPPELQNMTSLPRVTEPEPKLPQDMTKQHQHLVKLLRRGDINTTPLGTTTNTECLPEFEDTVDPDDLQRAVSAKTMRKKKFRIHDLIGKQIKRSQDSNPSARETLGWNNTDSEDVPATSSRTGQVNRQHFSTGPNGRDSLSSDRMSRGGRNFKKPMYSRNRRNTWGVRNVGMSTNSRNFEDFWDASDVGRSVDSRNVRGNNYSGQQPPGTGWGSSTYSDHVDDQNSHWYEYMNNYRLSRAAMDRYSMPDSYGSGYNQPSSRYNS